MKIAAIAGDSQGAISKILKRSRETGTPNQRPHGYRWTLKHSREDPVLLIMVCFNWFHSSPRLRVEFNRRIGHRISARTINRRVSTAGYSSRRPARWPRLTREHRRRCRQWARRHRDWDLRYWRRCVFSDEPHFKLFITVMVGFKFACVKGIEAPFAITLCWFKIMLLYTRQGPLWFFSKISTYRSWTGQPKARI